MQMRHQTNECLHNVQSVAMFGLSGFSLSWQHLIQVSHHVGNYSPDGSALVHPDWVLDCHGVPF